MEKFLDQCETSSLKELNNQGDYMKRQPTKYPGVFYRECSKIGSTGTEKVYYIVFKKDGKTLEEKVGRQTVDNMTPAKAASIRSERIEGKRQSRKELRAKAEQEKLAALSRWTFDRLWDTYKTNNPDLKGLVFDENRYQNHIRPLFGQKEPRELSPLDIDRFRLKLLKSHKPATVKNTLELLRRLINYGIKKHLCDGTAFTIEMPRVNNIKTEDLTPVQLNTLINTINNTPNAQVANFMKMGLYTGMRRGELFRLTWNDIDFERGFIHIRDPKGGDDQVIPLNDAARNLLAGHPRTDGSPYVFPGRGGNKRTDINKQVNQVKCGAGLPNDFRPLHGLRHVYASTLASSGKVDMYTLQKLLTHKSPQMTQRYAHLRDEAMAKASNLAGELLTENGNNHG